MVVISAAAIIAVIWFAWIAWRRSGRRWRVAVVESLRVVLVTVAIGLLWQPETTYQIDSERKGEVVLLIDRSASMQTRDVQSGLQSASRQEIADRIRGDAAWTRLDNRFKKVDLALDESSDESNDDSGDGGSDLGGALDRAAERHESAVAFVLVSDGDFNRGRSPVQAAAEIAARSGGRARVNSIPIGSPDRLPDIELVSADVPTFGVVAKPVQIPFTIRNWFGEIREVTVSLREVDRVADTQTLSIRPGARFDGAFLWQSDQAGTYALTIQSPVIESETNPENNRLSKTIEIREEKLRVLVIEGTPRWEYRYLRNALLRDPGIDVSCLLYHPELPGVGGGGEDYLASLPEDPAELASYDVIFLGDVGVAEGQLTVEQCRQIRGLVEQQAVGLVLMPGPRGRQASLFASELGELIPVVIDRARPLGVGNGVPASFALTGAGRRSLLTALDDDPQTNWAVWESLPGFYWYAAVTRAKAGSEVLAVHAEASNQSGRVPLLVTRPAAAGKVLFMGSDSVWRWRMGVEDKYHYRFWGQVIRWMAYQRNMAVGETMRLSYRPDQPEIGETVTLRASVMTSGGMPSQADAATVEIVSPTGSSRSLRLQREDSQWGVFTAQTQLDQYGVHALTLRHPSEESTVRARVAVQGRGEEQVGRPARRDIMREVAKVGRGQTFAADQVGQLVDQLNRLPPDPSTMRRIQWWNHPAVLSAIIAGLALFWVARKWAGGV
ncbi:hypothetical protein Enr13x_67730 [Stieleria neptunia]|uniref:VWFA domain-containing protein n=1 Tax=Stieleria neptunia TaxID=2527979 RepID=A0A518I1F8_9BACT|nr:hypothetical protein [Stieleria neptunia]QDV46864.1 hypothetical protein Enr13x_67730 [Stieleria neptunia]